MLKSLVAGPCAICTGNAGTALGDGNRKRWRCRECHARGAIPRRFRWQISSPLPDRRYRFRNGSLSHTGGVVHPCRCMGSPGLILPILPGAMPVGDTAA